jgi:hypothetical protein
MSKKNLVLISFVVVLGAVYLYYFTDLFAKPTFAISARPRIEPRSSRGAEKYSVSFNFDTRTKMKLNEVKVVRVAELETNKYPHAVWHLISDNGSSPMKGIIYGETIKGMKPKVPKMKPEPLEPNVKYRLLVNSDKRSGQADFEIPGRKQTVQ